MPALADLAPLFILVVALGLALLATLIVKATLGTIASALSHIPGIGSALNGAVNAVNQAILNKLGSAVSGIESAIGWTWHESAKLTDWLGREIYRHSTLVQAVVQVVHALAAAERGLRNLVHHASSTATGLGHRVGRLEKEWHGIEGEVKQLERDVAKGIGHDLRIQVAGLTKELGRVESKVIPGLRSAVNTAEADVTALEKYVADNVPLIGSTALVGAVAWALSRLGLGGLRCNSLANSLNKRGCGFWSDLEGLLGLFADVLAFGTLCEIVPLLSTAFADLAKPFVVALSEATAPICGQPKPGWSQLDVAPGPLPPTAQTLGPIP